MLVKDVTKILEELAPLPLQESYDNAGLLVGDAKWVVKGILCTIDITESIIDEAIELQANLIIAHHPFIFSSIKSLTGKNATERIAIKAIQNNIAIYAAHTNLDNVPFGVNYLISEKIGLQNTRILRPTPNKLVKLVTFVPLSNVTEVRTALMENGAGHIGNYDYCSFSTEGSGTFRGGDNSNPYVGEKGKIHEEPEARIETIIPEYTVNKAIHAMIKAHPYEEVAYDIYPLKNKLNIIGAGMIGELPVPLPGADFLSHIKKVFNIPAIRYSGKENKTIQRIAVCGGSGSFLLADAISQQADAFLTGDIKYHQFFDAEEHLLYCDIGHYESEQFTKELFYNLLTKKISTFAVHLTSIVTNPIKYYV